MSQRVLLFLACLFLQTGLNAEQLPALSERSAGFTENKGQFRDQNGNTNPSVLYMADFGGLKVQIHKNGFSYEMGRIKPQWVDPETIPYRIITVNDRGDTMISWPGKAEAEKNLMYHYHRIDIRLEGCNPQIEIIPELKETGGRRMLVEGSSKIAETGRFGQIRYQEIYPGIDMVCYAISTNGGFKYDFILHPGADPSSIRLNYAGAGDLFLSDEGNLEIKTRFGSLMESIPLCYSEDAAGVRTPIEGIHYQLSGNTIKFKGTEIQNREVVIDPAVNLHWAAFFGGYGEDYCTASVIDASGNTYLCGGTKSSQNIATAGSYQDSLLLPEDGFLTKYSGHGQLVWSTYLNNTPAVDLDIQNNLAVLTGNKIMKFDTDGNFLWQINTMQGLKAICMDRIENMVAVGDSTCPDYGVSFHMDTIVKYNAAGILQWSQSFGESNTYINDVGLDTAGNIYFVGQTNDSTGISTENSHLPVYNGTFPSLTGWDYRYEGIGNERSGDGFIGKFDPDGQLIFGTYYGGKYFDQVNRISVGENGTFVIAGETNSRTGISSPGSWQDTLAQQGRYTFLKIAIGGAFDCDPGWPLIDTCIIGHYTPTPYDWRCQSTDAFFAKFSPEGTRIWGTYYGDNGSDFSTCVNMTGDCDTITIAGNTPGNLCFHYFDDCPPSRLATDYSYLKISDTYYNNQLAYLAQFDSTGNRIWGTYFPKVSDVPPDNANRFSVADVNHLKREIIVSGTNHSLWSLGYPQNAYVFTFNTADIDTILEARHSNVCIGDTTVLKIGVTTDPVTDLEYQWIQNGSIVEGATDSVLIINSTLPADTGNYYCNIIQGDFSWSTDSVNVAVREDPVFDKFLINGQDLLLTDARLLTDMDNSGDYDVICNQEITYSDSLAFLRTDSISSLNAEVSVSDILNDQELFIFTHEALCQYNPGCTRPSKLQRIQNGHLRVFESEILDRVLTWADFDNDGKPEGIETKFGQQGYDIFHWVYLVEFENGTVYEKVAGQVFFGNYSTNLPEVDAADYDSDGDIDLLFTGIAISGTSYLSTSILLNSGGVFQEMPLPVPQYVQRKGIQWFDADADSDLDFLFNHLILTDISPYFGMVLTIYTNLEGNFVPGFSDTIPVAEQNANEDVLIFDYNNDGQLDLLFKNYIFQKNATSYVLTPSTFNPAHTGLTEDAKSFGDFDNDGDLDILGVNGLFTNEVCNINSLPTAPSALSAIISNDTATFSWQQANDPETPQPGLTYNLRVGTTPGGNEIMSSMSDSTGWRKVARMGNVYQNTSWRLHDLPPGTYYWSVQAIDNSYAGGAFAQEESFSIFAQSTTWTGAIDSLWNKPGNWSDGLPGENTTVIIPGEPVNQPVLNMSTSNRKLILESGSELIINSYKLLNLSDSLIIIQHSPADSTKLIIRGNIEIIQE